MILTLGESVYDIIFEQSQPKSSGFGGSMFNVAVSLSRSSGNVGFAGFYAEDKIGLGSVDFLTSNGVDTRYFAPVKIAKSNIALAFLNDKKVPTYSFYRDEKLAGNHFDINFDEISRLITGSFYALNNVNFPKVKKVIEQARNNNVEIIYDPNIRNKNVHKLPELKQRVEFYMQKANLIKLSDEDLRQIIGSDDVENYKEYLVQFKPQAFIITRGDKETLAFFNGQIKTFEVPKVDVKNSVGAGDSFTAGFASAGSDVLKNEDAFFKAVKRGIAFGSHVCTHEENYVSKNFTKDLENGKTKA